MPGSGATSWQAQHLTCPSDAQCGVGVVALAKDATTDAVSLAIDSRSVHAAFSDFPAVRLGGRSIICVKTCQKYLSLCLGNCGILIPDLISPGVKLSEKRIFISGSFATGNSGSTRLYRRLLVPHRCCWETRFRGIASHLDSLFPPKGETRKTGYPNLIQVSHPFRSGADHSRHQAR